MDLQTATFGMMYWQTVASLAQAVILIITAEVIGWYTVETYRLRKAAQEQVRESQRQIELQLQPYVVLEAIKEGSTRGFQLRNVGNGTAIDVIMRDIQVKFPDITGTISFRDPIPIISSGDIRLYSK